MAFNQESNVFIGWERSAEGEVARAHTSPGGGQRTFCEGAVSGGGGRGGRGLALRGLRRTLGTSGRQVVKILFHVSWASGDFCAQNGPLAMQW